MFRIIIAALAIIGLASLVTGAGTGVAIGAIALVPLFFLMKLMFLAFIFSWFVRGARRPGRSSHWGAGWKSEDMHTFMDRMGRKWGGSGRAEARTTTEVESPKATRDRFDQWHDLAHAREEVESWVDDPEE